MCIYLPSSLNLSYTHVIYTGVRLNWALVLVALSSAV